MRYSIHLFCSTLLFIIASRAPSTSNTSNTRGHDSGTAQNKKTNLTWSIERRTWSMEYSNAARPSEEEGKGMRRIANTD
ncbi:hypothetical protein F5B18DRAFT_623617 [Nemania serpens]|nr:hypothetical protein F5B18DRAFT_623617 [Nemania serpens]